jgi:hypothetical protein
MNGPGRRRGMAIALGVSLALALPLVASASGGGPAGGSGNATISFGSAKVIGKVVAEIQVNVVCDPLTTIDPYGQETTTTEGYLEFGWLNLLQSQGRAVASGSGELYGPVTCDGTTVNGFIVDIAATTRPWKTGTAVASAGVSISDPAFFSGDSGTTGPVTLKLTK